MSLLEVWRCVLHARQHIIKTASIEAIEILWEAEGAIIQERNPNYADIHRRLNRTDQGSQRSQDLEQTEQEHAALR